MAAGVVVFSAFQVHVNWTKQILKFSVFLFT